MPRTMTKVVPVKITTDEINCYATIERSMLAAITACLRLQADKTKGKHINPQIDKLRAIKNWAEDSFDACVEKQMDDAGNPAEG